MSYMVIADDGMIWRAMMMVADAAAGEVVHCAVGQGDATFDNYPDVGDPVALAGNAGDDTAASGGSYSGYDDESYLVEVTKGGAPGTAEITVIGQQASDNSGPTVVTAFGSGTGIGTKGATIAFTDGGDGLLTLGDKWTVFVEAAKPEDGALHALVGEFARKTWWQKKYLVENPSGPIKIGGVSYDYSPADAPTKFVLYDFKFTNDEANDRPIREYAFFADDAAYNTAQVLAAIADAGNTGDDTATSGGTYSGTVNETYEVEVTTGGAPGTAQITVTGLQNGDNSGPTTVTAFGTPVAIGSGGATISFADGGDAVLTLGDKWKVACTKNVAGPYAVDGVYDRDTNQDGEVAVGGTMMMVKNIVDPLKDTNMEFKPRCLIIGG